MSAFSISVIDKLIQPLKKPASMEDPSAEGEPPFSFYPPLYVTPPVEPRRPSSPSPSSPSTSPYVVNFKRRGVRMQNHADENTRCRDLSEDEQTSAHDDTAFPEMEGVGERNPSYGFASSGYDASKEVCDDALKTDIEIQMVEDDGRREEAVLASNMSDLGDYSLAQGTKTKPQLALNDGTKSVTGLECSSFTSPRASTFEEFYDAPEAPLDDSTSEEESRSSNLTLKRLGMSAEELAPCLQEEIARRRRAEEALRLLQERWNEVAQKFSSIGILMTANEDTVESSRTNVHGVYEQRLAVARVVSGAVASAAMRAAKDEDQECLLANKSWEISRLCDKLQYVELVNREMSQRNQEVIEIAQRRRRRHKRRQKWVVGALCSAVCLGTAGLLCYKLIPWNQAGTRSRSLKSSAQD